jgi:hypothetical protein
VSIPHTRRAKIVTRKFGGLFQNIGDSGRNVPRHFLGFDSVDVPYRLDTVEAINTAKREDFLNLGKGYNLMMMAALNGDLHYPQAFRKAKKSVKKDFTVIDEEVICKIDVRYEEILDLDLAGNLDRIEGKIPWLEEMARYESTFQYIETFPPDVRNALAIERTILSPSQMLAAHFALRSLIKREVVHFVKAGRTKLVDLDSLKRLITAMALFDSPQQDILHLLKTGEATGDYKGAVSEYTRGDAFCAPSANDGKYGHGKPSCPPAKAVRTDSPNGHHSPSEDDFVRLLPAHLEPAATDGRLGENETG